MRERAETVLRALAGPDAHLRDDQWRAISALVEQRRRALVVQRTGWGKSAVYFIATALLRERGAGATVIVSPLLALMRNQIAAAERAGIHARSINSANVEEWDQVAEEIHAGHVDVLLVSPERLNNPDFRDDVLPRLAATTGLLVVDEAHCISDWGHDFRPDYRRLRTLLAGLPAGIPVLATTATANARVSDDVAEQLAADAPTLVLRGSLDRASLRLGVVRLPSGAHRLAWLADHLRDLPGSGIVYTLTVAQAEDVAAFLRTVGYPVAAYSGRTDTADRTQAEDDLLHNRVKALVATSALGMGFDKPDLGFVVHVGAPQSPIAYYQQVGRAGRGVAAADVILLPGQEDEAIWRYYARLGFPAEQHVRRCLAVLAESAAPLSTAALEPHVELNRTRLETMLKVLDVDGAVRRVRGGWSSTGQPWEYDAQRYNRVAQVRRDEQQAMREYVATDECRLGFLRRQLDDPEAADCGRCDTCRGPFVDVTVSEATLAAARTELNRPGVDVEPRMQWPTALAALGIPLSGRIKPPERAEPGRAVARLSDIGWGPRLRQLLAEQAADQPVPDEVFGAVVDVLRTWGWAERPAGIVSVPSERRPLLVRSLAERIAEVGRLPYLGRLDDRRDGHSAAVGGRTNSAQRLRALFGAFAVPDAMGERLAGLAGLAGVGGVGGAPVLLVDDLAESGWTLTLAARELRLAGSGPVLPLVLAIAS